jgi:hypothetical protein
MRVKRDGVKVFKSGAEGIGAHLFWNRIELVELKVRRTWIFIGESYISKLPLELATNFHPKAINGEPR